MVRPLRGAIVGYGLAGSVFHAPLIAVDAGPRGRDDRDRAIPGAATQALRENPGARVVPSADEVWERADEHDFAVIAARNDAHVPLARRGLDAGLAVVVDKPLAPSAAEAAALVEHARAAGKLLTVFQNRRWDSDQRTLRRLLSEGELGDVLRYESRFERWRPELREQAWRESAGAAEGGGVLLDLGSHLVDQALQLFGPATHVYGEVDSRRGAAGDDDAFVALRHRAGTYSHLRASALAAAPGPRLRVLGTRGAYVVPEVDGQEDALRAGPAAGRSGRVGRRARGTLGTPGSRRGERAGAERARCLAVLLRESWSAPCGRAARRRSSPRTRSRRSACSRRPGAAPPSSR